MATTLKDVALKAGVSVKTVSNVVNNYPYVTDAIRLRVKAAINELQYQPNLSARYLRKGRSGILAFANPDLSNAYFSEIGQVVIEAAKARSYTVLLDHTGGERSNEQDVVRGLSPHLIDGVILSPFALEPEDLQPRQESIPIVLLGDRIYDVPYDHVTYDNVATARLATQHLLSLGRRRIAALGVQEAEARETETSRLRLRGYLEALEEAGVPLDPHLIIRGLPSFSRFYGARAMRQLLSLDTPPDAIFCFNDLLALGAMRAIFEADYRVPEDIAVVGFDDIEEGRYAVPSLTTIAPDKQKIGDLAVAFLLGRIDGTRTGPPERIEVSCQLIVRESSTLRG
ncbi:LacI family DNA-binding transcriptional regulator [Dictyobacter arantiisoli]|uniref:LacI family transcriptional regulator n=1 Tax=Dictyobacter arantiisoli TaxID=2014874 RepID=A0A5A5TL80_9CHLR|nr:LacI family DNA-binding transcriptional regulator [Dictyobacter arantiisoli]GCF11886.1 LacI family transcriptional regulator [Dictyobacter arantiisoli]